MRELLERWLSDAGIEAEDEPSEIVRDDLRNLALRYQAGLIHDADLAQYAIAGPSGLGSYSSGGSIARGPNWIVTAGSTRNFVSAHYSYSLCALAFWFVIWLIGTCIIWRRSSGAG